MVRSWSSAPAHSADDNITAEKTSATGRLIRQNIRSASLPTIRYRRSAFPLSHVPARHDDFLWLTAVPHRVSQHLGRLFACWWVGAFNGNASLPHGSREGECARISVFREGSSYCCSERRR